MRSLLFLLLILPGITGIAKLYPYPYTYYNSLIGGVGGAYRQYETDHWLTCYEEQVARVNREVTEGTTIFVFRQPELAVIYAEDCFTIEPYEPERTLLCRAA